MNILEMSFAASVLIVATVIVRAVGLYLLPKKVFLCLWGIAALRLLVPLSIPAPFGFPLEWTAPVSDFVASPDTYVPLETAGSPNDASASIPIALIIWLAGICACGLFFAISYCKSCREFKTALPVESRFIDRWLKEHPLQRPVQIRRSDRTTVPLTYGIFHPVILLPKEMDLTDETSLRYVLAHEHIHIRHFDTLIKLMLVVVVCLHWFNPLAWVMFILANRDIELICDETLVKSFESDEKSAYALTLIRLAEVKRQTAVVNYFSKNFIEERITAVMKTKKYTLPIMMVALMLVAGAVTVFAAAAPAADSTGNAIEKKTDGTDLGLCNVAGCNTTGVHQHNGKHYSGHSKGDGHDYHAVCNVDGCTEVAEHGHEFATSTNEESGLNDNTTSSTIEEQTNGTELSLCNVAGCNATGVHQHNGKQYFGHSKGDGHNYHAVCNVDGCTEVAEHGHEFDASVSMENGHHNSGHDGGSHH